MKYAYVLEIPTYLYYRYYYFPPRLIENFRKDPYSSSEEQDVWAEKH